MFRMYNGQHDEEYHLMDSVVEEQYLIGGVTAWLYAYEGPGGNDGSKDATKPDYEALGSKVTDIGNYVWMETSDRKYSLDAIEIPVVYQTQDASMDMQIPGLFLFETMDITLPYNLMIERLGRKIMKGDVLELANLRDAHPLDEDSDAINRFYVVHDAFKSGDGYSHTWFHHIWKLRVVPMVDSPEFRDILGDGSHEDDLVNSISTRQKELDIMDLIVGQADSEVPYMHWNNEHINDSGDLKDVNNKYNPQDQREALPAPEDIVKGDQFPMDPKEGMWFLRTDQNPETLWKFEKLKWRKFEYGGRFQWTGADKHKADYVNNRETYTDKGVEKPSRVAQSDIVKPGLDD